MINNNTFIAPPIMDKYKNIINTKYNIRSNPYI